MKSAGTDEIAPGILLDFDADGRPIGIEVLDVRDRMRTASADAVPTAAE